jgi:hypothetical protein
MSQRKSKPKSSHRVFSREFKIGIVCRMLAGENVSALARELKMTRKDLYAWRDRFQAGGLQVDDELEFSRLHDWKVGWLFALQYAGGIGSHLAQNLTDRPVAGPSRKPSSPCLDGRQVRRSPPS